MTDDIKQAPCPTEREQFEAWWEGEGQFVRAGGGNYEKTFAYQAWQAARAQAPAPHELPSKVAPAHFDQNAVSALVQQLLAALESCGAGAVEDGGQQWYDSRLVDAAHEAASDWLAAHGITGAPNA